MKTSPGLSEASIIYAILSFVKSAVPLFVMLSGALLLGKNESFSDFFKKRFKRILLPFFVWSPVVYILYYVKHYTFNFESFIGGFIIKTLTCGVVEVYWYIYLIIGLYLFTPFLRKLFGALTGKESFQFCMLLLGIYLLSYLFPEVTIASGFLSKNLIYFFYFCFGFVIINYLQSKKYFVISLLMFVFGWIGQSINVITNLVSFPFIILMSIGLFGILVSEKNFHIFTYSLNKKILSFVTYLSSISYGVYLVHIVFISFFSQSKLIITLPLWAQPVLLSIITLSICCFLFYPLKKLPISRWIM